MFFWRGINLTFMLCEMLLWAMANCMGNTGSVHSVCSLLHVLSISWNSGGCLKLVSARNLVNLLQFKYQALELWSKAVPESLSTDLLMWAVNIPGLRSVPRCLSISTADSTFLAQNRCEKLYPMLNIFLFEKKWQGHGKQAQAHTWPCQLLAMIHWNYVLICKICYNYCIPLQAVESIKW